MMRYIDKVTALLLFAALGFSQQIFSAPPQSDDFNSLVLNTGLWSIVDPVGDANVSHDGTRLNITVPAGTSHDVWSGGNLAPRVMQFVDNTDFGIEVKFESPVSSAYQLQGLLIEQDSSNYIRADFYNDGTNPRLFVATFTNGAPEVRVDSVVASTVPAFLRIDRSASIWTVFYSLDGTNWQVGANFSFPLAVASAGVFAGNAGSNPPLHTAVVDYFFNQASPIVPEDSIPQVDTTPPQINGVSILAGANNIQVNWSTNELADGIVNYGLTTTYELGSVSHTALSPQHELNVLGLNPETTYNLRITTSDESGNTTVSENHVITTQAPGISDLPVIDVWNGLNQRFGDIGIPQRWINILGKVIDPDGIQTLSYTLNDGPSIDLSLGPIQYRRLANPGDFNIDINIQDLSEGNNVVLISAVDQLGFTSQEAVNVNFTSGNVWPDNFSIDWSAVTAISDVAQVVDGKWVIEGDKLRTAEIGYDRLIAIGDMATWDNYEVTVPITIHQVDESNQAPAVGVLMRWDGHYEWTGEYATQPSLGWWPMGALGWYQFNPDDVIGTEHLSMIGNIGFNIATDQSGKKLELATPYVFKFRVQTLAGQGSLYRFKVWEEGTTEPLAWDLEALQSLATDPQAGSILLLAHHIDASFGAVNVVALSEAPSDFPPVISNIEVTAIGEDTATVSWNTNTPTTSQVDYGVSTSYGQLALDTTLKTSHSVVLTGLSGATIYHYQVGSTDEQSRTAVSTDHTFTTMLPGAQLPGPALSDGFDGTLLDPKWWTVDPKGDGSVSMTGTQVVLSVPGGIDHDVWATGIDAPRIMQALTDADFEAEVKFDSLPTQQYQLQGILVEQDADNFIRFDFYSDGSSLNIFSASFVNGTSTVRSDTSIASGSPLYMRVKRLGSNWIQSYSYDGLNWTQAVSFSHSMTMNAIGVFAGNAGGGAAPAYAAMVDHFIVAADSIPVEDTTAPVISNVAVNITSATTADISWNTNEPTSFQLDYGLTPGYEIGNLSDTVLGTSHAVSLTGLTANTQYHFEITAIDASGNVGVSGEQVFTPADLPLMISNVQVTAIGEETATINWTTNRPASSQVDYGLNAGYGNTLTDVALKTSHSLVLSGLTSGTEYHYRLTSIDDQANVTISSDQVLTTSLPGPPPAGPVQSDLFDGTLLDPKWVQVDPKGDGSVSMTGTQVALTVPAGSDHDVWTTGNDALRIMQAVADTDFQVEVKFDSLPTQPYQIQGLIVDQAAGDFIRFDFYSDGSSLNIFSASFVNGTPTMRANTPITNGTPLYMRVGRTGSNWTQSYSYDGLNWIQAASFSHGLTMNSIGMFAGNAGGGAPAFTALVDFFEVNGASGGPMAANDSYVVDEDLSLVVPAATGLLANDVDIDLPDDLVAVLATNPVNGVLIGWADNGAFTYLPNQNFSGVDSFNYQAVDAVSGAKTLATVTITVNAMNDAPIAVDDTVQIEPNLTTILNLGSTLFANDKDGDGDALSIASFTQPINGTLLDNGDGTLTYTPLNGFIGVDNFAYAISDGANLSNTASVAVSIESINHPPQLVSATAFFTKQLIDITVDQTHSVVAADLDGDGDLDLAATDYVDGAVFWYQNDGASFVKKTIDATLTGAYPAQISDVDGDGDMDVLAAGYLADTLAWYENDSIGNFTRHDVDSAADGVHSVVADDMDGDGDIDLLTTNQDAGTVTWYEKDASNAFIKHTIDTAALGAKYAIFSDIDNDGDSDVVSASFFDDRISWYENDGAQNFTKRIIDTVADGAYYVSAAHLDGDGHIDILAASQLDNTIAWYKNDGFGNFTKQVIDAGADGARTVIAADIDSDGDMDAIAASVNDDSVIWHNNDGNGGFTSSAIDSAADGAYGLFAADIDGDGQIDVLSASRDANAVAVHYQQKTHAASLARGDTLLIDSALLLTTDTDDSAAELTYTISNIPGFGQLLLNGIVLDNGAIFTQDDVDNLRLSYAHDGLSSSFDSFSFFVADGGENGVLPIAADFALNITDGLADAFGGSALDPKWTIQDPKGDGSVAMTGTHVALSVPGGNDHDVWSAGNEALRIEQAVADTDFEAEVKFDSLPTQQYQIQGFIVEQDAANFLRFDFYSDGSSLTIFSASFVNGAPTVRTNTIVSSSTPLHMRVNRTGNMWTQSYSHDGLSWTQAASFSHSLSTNSLSVFAGNAGGGSAPAYTALVDSFLINAF